MEIENETNTDMENNSSTVEKEVVKTDDKNDNNAQPFDTEPKQETVKDIEQTDVDINKQTDIENKNDDQNMNTDSELLEDVEKLESSSHIEQTKYEPNPEAKDNTSTSTSLSQGSNIPEASIYHLKWFEWKGIQTPIVTQNENGPCPLLAIANVLILARKISLPPMQQLISGKQLMEYIGDCILSSAPDNEGNTDELILNYQQNMQDAIDIMYKLQTGIDVNVKFSGVCDFEFTRECIVFDLLKIALYHGWLVDPQDAPTSNALKQFSYNQIVEKMLTAKESTDDSIVSEGLVIEEFLNRSASQLTYHGLCELNDTVQEEELCVFFRNNHFSTLYKFKGELFLLVTDQGFLTEPAVIWETLANIEGDGQFVNSEFRTITLQSNALPPPPSTPLVAPVQQPVLPSTPTQHQLENMTQEDQDYLIALSLQQEHGSPVAEEPQQQQDIQTNMDLDSDHALALRLQEDEDRHALEREQQQQQPPRVSQHVVQQQQQQQQLRHQLDTVQTNTPPRRSASQETRDANSPQEKNCSIL